MFRIFLLGLVVLAIGGCVLGPDYVRPDIESPSTYRMQPDADVEASVGDLGWWELFQDIHLHALIQHALVKNNDLRLATARVQEARAQLLVTGADQIPQVDGNASFQRNQASGAVANQVGVPEASNRQGPTTNQFRATADLSFEIDLWGRLRRATEAAQAVLLAQEWARRTVVFTLISDLAESYFDLQELDLELATSNLTLKTRQESLEIIRLRKLMGQSSALDARRAEQEVARAQAVIPDLQRQIIQKENQLSILIGNNPRTIVRSGDLREQTLPPEVPAGIPSALLDRRPDIQQAEQELIAANARIGIAKAAFFPQISLTGNFGAQSLDFSDLFIGPSRVWSLGPKITVPIFQGGRNLGNLEMSEARQEQALITFEKTIQQAFREVEDALIAHQKTREKRIAEERLIKVSREALQLAQLEYLNGQAAYLDVLVAQRELFNAEIALAKTQRNLLVAVVQVYKALGGGWSPDAQSHDLSMLDRES